LQSVLELEKRRGRRRRRRGEWEGENEWKGKEDGEVMKVWSQYDETGRYEGGKKRNVLAIMLTSLPHIIHHIRISFLFFSSLDMSTLYSDMIFIVHGNEYHETSVSKYINPRREGKKNKKKQKSTEGEQPGDETRPKSPLAYYIHCSRREIPPFNHLVTPIVRKILPTKSVPGTSLPIFFFIT
jgi:hypothetical protein